jgi:hypothetical protein
MACKRAVHHLKAMSFILGVYIVMATKTKETKHLLNNLTLVDFLNSNKTSRRIINCETLPVRKKIVSVDSMTDAGINYAINSVSTSGCPQ